MRSRAAGDLVEKTGTQGFGSEGYRARGTRNAAQQPIGTIAWAAAFRTTTSAVAKSPANLKKGVAAIAVASRGHPR